MDTHALCSGHHRAHRQQGTQGQVLFYPLFQEEPPCWPKRPARARPSRAEGSGSPAEARPLPPPGPLDPSRKPFALEEPVTGWVMGSLPASPHSFICKSQSDRQASFALSPAGIETSSINMPNREGGLAASGSRAPVPGSSRRGHGFLPPRLSGQGEALGGDSSPRGP